MPAKPTRNARRRTPIFYVLALVGTASAGLAIWIGARALRASEESGGAGEFNSAVGLEQGTRTDVRSAVGATRGLYVQIMDREDPTRLAGELQSETIDPIQPQRYRVGAPRAWIYLNDGRSVHVQALGGTLVMPDRARAPESGTLEGDVLIRLYAPMPEGRRASIENDDPALTLRGQSLTFDTSLGEVSTGLPFRVDSAEFSLEAGDAKVLINQTLERLERLIIRNGGSLLAHELDAGTRAHTDASGGMNKPGAQGKSPEQHGGEAGPAPEPRVTLYQAVFRGNDSNAESPVALTRDGQLIRGDRLELFARVVDNTLPPGAIAGTPGATTGNTPPNTDAGVDPTAGTLGETATGAEPGAGPRAETGGETPAPDETSPTDNAAGETRLTWTGPLDVRPLDEEPPELVREHVLARFSAERSGVVEFRDDGSVGSGRAAVVEYGMTTQSLLLAGPARENVQLDGNQGESLRVGRLELNLATGVGHVSGPGTASASSDGRRLDWGEQADFLFEVREGRMTGALREAMCAGSARATDGTGFLESGYLRAIFGASGDGSTRLRTLHARDGVEGNDGQGGSLACKELDVDFADSAEVAPSFVAARGDVRARSMSTTGALRAEVSAGTLEVELATTTGEGGEDSLGARMVRARGDVEFVDHEEDVTVRGESVVADVQRQTIETAGEGAMVSRAGTSIGGEHVRLDGTSRTAEAFGAGWFSHDTGTEGAPGTGVQVSWSEGMAFDDLAGRVECLGSVHAEHKPDSLTRESLDADSVRVELDAITTSGAEGAAEVAQEGEGTQARRVLRVEAAGSVFSRGEGAGARAESVSYAAPGWADADAPVVRALRLSGPRILADNLTGTLDVPGAGRLVAADLRPGEPGSADERGSALFDWGESLSVERGVGRAIMRGGVVMNSARPSDGLRVMLECASLTTHFREGGEGAEGAIPQGGTIRSAVAEGSVYLRADGRELVADLLEYDPEAGLAEAIGGDGRSVTFVDPQTLAPITAEAIVWNLTTGRVDVVDIRTIVIPR